MEQPSPQPSRRSSVVQAVRTLTLAKKWTRAFKSRRESSFTEASSKREPVIPMENTYKLTPDPGKEVRAGQMHRDLLTLLELHLKSETYSPACSELTRKLSQHANRCVRKFDTPRYKFVCHVILGENKGQSISHASRCLWDERTDTYTCVSFKNASLFCTVTAYGVYLA